MAQEKPKKTGYEEFSEVDGIFREKHEDILRDMTTVLEEYGISGYRVTDVTFEPPNPRLCVPYCRWVPGDGIVCGVSCFDV